LKSSWTEYEDQMLKKLVEEKGAKDWNYIASILKGRVGK
jgi:hypothetical protein